MTRWLETDVFANKDISVAVAIGSYIADADRIIVCDVFVDQVLGGGDYIFHMTQQINGAGSFYVILKTTQTAAAGETSLKAQSGLITVRAGDVLTVYVDGLAGDNANPDTIVRWFELDALRPTVPDRTVDVDANGGVEVGSFQNGAITAAAIATDAIDADALANDAIVEIDTVLTASHGAGAWTDAGCAGAGSVEFVYTLTDAGTLLPIPQAEVWATTDLAGVNIVASSMTDNFGQVHLWLDPGIYFLWRMKSGYSFSNPDVETVV